MAEKLLLERVRYDRQRESSFRNVDCFSVAVWPNLKQKERQMTKEQKYRIAGK